MKTAYIDIIVNRHEIAYAMHHDDINAIYSPALQAVVPLGVALNALREALADEPLELLACYANDFTSRR